MTNSDILQYEGYAIGISKRYNNIDVDLDERINIAREVVFKVLRSVGCSHTGKTRAMICKAINNKFKIIYRDANTKKKKEVASYKLYLERLQKANRIPIQKIEGLMILDKLVGNELDKKIVDLVKDGYDYFEIDKALKLGRSFTSWTASKFRTRYNNLTKYGDIKGYASKKRGTWTER